MYASIRRYEGVDRATATDVARRGSGEVRERLSKRPGFVAYELVIGETSIAAITIFESWVTAEESNVQAAAWIRDNIADVNWPEPQITAGEVYEQPGSDRAPFTPPRLSEPRKVDADAHAVETS